MTLTFFPSLTPPIGRGWWVFNSTGYSIGYTSTIAQFPGGLHAIIDIGTKFLLLQQPFCGAYYTKAPFVIKDQNFDYFYPCSTTSPDLKLAIGSYPS